ncbi:scaffold protein Nfu/NifU [Russula brevipes]|nr:scaffold protein Nfu/NifU [Russula brevipes]
MFIQTETMPNADSLKFISGAPVMETRLASPLALCLFGIEGVKVVFYGSDFVTVTKDAGSPWSVLKPEVCSVLMPLFRSEEDRFSAGPQDTRILETDSETVAMIKELLDTCVRPAIMKDGGTSRIASSQTRDERTVRFKLKGSCRGCYSSTVTLKTGIERMLMHCIPEVKGTETLLAFS